METNLNSEPNPITEKSTKIRFSKFKDFFEKTNFIYGLILPFCFFLYYAFQYLFRNEIPEPLNKINSATTEMMDCINLDEIEPVVILDGRKPEGASIKMTVTKKFTKEDYSTEYSELNEGIVNFKLCKSSSDLVVFHTNVAGYPEIFENRYSPNAIPDTIFLTPQ